jgi:uncharacterized protein with FMN-binding domain
MRKSVIIIFAVAIIGALGLTAKGHKGDGASQARPAATGNSSTLGSSTSATAAMGTGTDTAAAAYKDGTYNGASENTLFGTVQIAAVVSGGKITDVQFLQMPSDLGHSQEVTAYAEPYLKDETIQKQSASISFVSGATTTSEAYAESLQAALDQAAVS